MTEWGCSGSLWVEEHGFATVEEVLSYRPLEDDRGVGVLQPAYQETRRQGARAAQEVAGDAVLVTGLYYTLLFQFCIMSFGWERFLEAAAVDPAGFAVVLDQFAELEPANVAAWAADDCPVLFVHDDVAVTRGLVFSPAWYRRELFPRYERILEPAFRAGRTVVFVSDGRFEELVDDLFALGIHGVMVDHTNDLAGILARHGRPAERGRQRRHRGAHPGHARGRAPRGGPGHAARPPVPRLLPEGRGRRPPQRAPRQRPGVLRGQDGAGLTGLSGARARTVQPSTPPMPPRTS